MRNYTIRKSARAKNLSITIRPDRSVTVTVPHRMSVVRAEEFVKEKQSWIDRVLNRLKNRPRPAYSLPKASLRDYREYKETARKIAEDRLRYFNSFYRTSWNRIAIKNTSSRWGSCSGLRNLNFSYRLAFLPPHLQDYLIVHELCHLFELNHSARFWKLVEQAIPDYATCRQELKTIP
jgi:predicted metal-dependent hydrolase